MSKVLFILVMVLVFVTIWQQYQIDSLQGEVTIVFNSLDTLYREIIPSSGEADPESLIQMINRMRGF